MYYIILYYTRLYSTLLYSTLLYYILYYTILYYTIVYYTILYYTILYYTILYYTILYYSGGGARRGRPLRPDAGRRWKQENTEQIIQSNCYTTISLSIVLSGVSFITVQYFKIVSFRHNGQEAAAPHNSY